MRSMLNELFYDTLYYEDYPSMYLTVLRGNAT